MKQNAPEDLLGLLLAFDGRWHFYERGYSIRFKIQRKDPTPTHPPELNYWFAFHAPDGRPLMGFDNSLPILTREWHSKERPTKTHHWYRTEHHPEQAYEFQDVDTLLQDFFSEVCRLLDDFSIPGAVPDVDKPATSSTERYRIQSSCDLEQEMRAVARGEKPAPRNAAQPSFESPEALERWLKYSPNYLPYKPHGPRLAHES
jgi:hypothetical protein